ncbi:hypothetical protein FZEAL_10736 [Fusarium zealandicum]|uniref:Tyrosine specific protein phosphatases domain-containing protein n=1 Tax=Fusarium zealandicum TaxID=1053134 RepID=A0A8H4X8A3_9HYPO|nr:hypothetical protein FZEAL_10736 [Fusarium zealandicum]
MSNLGPPFIPVPGIPNFRDLGGHTIKPGLVFRSGDPSRLTPAGISALQDLRISHVYDLRSQAELQRYSSGVREWPGARRVYAPVFLDRDYSPEAIALRFQHYSGEAPGGFVEAYRSIWESGTGPVGTILSHLASPDPSPILVHCTAGKDRTGVVCAIILSICGVDDAAIAREYSLTEVGLGAFKDELIAAVMKSSDLDIDRQGAERMLGAKPESMLAALKELRNQYGSVEQYVVEKCGLSSHDVEQIRKNLILPGSNGP